MTQTMASQLLNYADFCRRAQNEYFRCRTQENLRAAKAAERDLDKAIKAAKEQERSGIQMDLNFKE